MLYYYPTRMYAYKVELAQYAELRVAMRYHNSTPCNIILAEAKVMMIQHRAIVLQLVI